MVERADAERSGPISGGGLMAAAANEVSADAAAVEAAVQSSPSCIVVRICLDVGTTPSALDNPALGAIIPVISLRARA